MTDKRRLFRSFGAAIVATALASACRHESPTAPAGSGTTIWTGVITYSGTQPQPCSPSEQLAVSVQLLADGQLYWNFRTGCYNESVFVGQVGGNALTGQLRLGQSCVGNDGECCVGVTGQASGTLQATHIHLETPQLRGGHCNWGGSVIDLHR